VYFEFDKFSFLFAINIHNTFVFAFMLTVYIVPNHESAFDDSRIDIDPVNFGFNVGWQVLNRTTQMNVCTFFKFGDSIFGICHMNFPA
jgi:hypothetical protein